MHEVRAGRAAEGAVLSRRRWRVPWRDRQGHLSALKILALIAVTLPAVWLTYRYFNDTYRRGIAGTYMLRTGDWATYLLLATLLVTPLRRLFPRSRLLMVRRTIGIAALVYTAAHLVLYFIWRRWNWEQIGGEAFSDVYLALGVVAAVAMLMLGMTSFDAAISRFGAAGWRRLHRLIYVLTALSIIHFLLIPRFVPDLAHTLLGLFLWLMGWRVLDRFRLGTAPLVLLGLALAAAFATAWIETWWTNYSFGFSARQLLERNTSFAFGVPAGWRVLGAGLAFTFVALTVAVFGVHRGGHGRGNARLPRAAGLPFYARPSAWVAAGTAVLVVAVAWWWLIYFKLAAAGAAPAGDFVTCLTAATAACSDAAVLRVHAVAAYDPTAFWVGVLLLLIGAAIAVGRRSPGTAAEPNIAPPVAAEWAGGVSPFSSRAANVVAELRRRGKIDGDDSR